MEGHPEEDDHGKHEQQGHDALLGLFLAQLGLGSGSSGFGLLAGILGVAEGAAGQVVDGDGEHQRCAGHHEGEVIGLTRGGVTQMGLGIFSNLDGSGRGEQRTDVDGHVEQRETGVTLVGIARVVIEVAHHYLQVALEQTCAQADEQQGGQHSDDGDGLPAQRHRQQQVAQEHDDDTDGHHLAITEFVGKVTADNREEVDEHEEVTIDFPGPFGVETEV